MSKPNPNELYVELQGQLLQDDVERIKHYLRNNPIEPSSLEKCETFPAICLELQRKGKIKPDKDSYSFLKRMFKFLVMPTLRDRVKKFEDKCTSYRSSLQASRKRKLDQSTEPKSKKIKSPCLPTSGRNPKPSVNIQAHGSATQTGNIGNIQNVNTLTMSNQYPSSKQAARAKPKKKHAGSGTKQAARAKPKKKHAGGGTKQAARAKPKKKHAGGGTKQAARAKPKKKHAGGGTKQAARAKT